MTNERLFEVLEKHPLPWTQVDSACLEDADGKIVASAFLVEVLVSDLAELALEQKKEIVAKQQEIEKLKELLLSEINSRNYWIEQYNKSNPEVGWGRPQWAIDAMRKGLQDGR